MILLFFSIIRFSRPQVTSPHSYEILRRGKDAGSRIDLAGAGGQHHGALRLNRKRNQPLSDDCVVYWGGAGSVRDHPADRFELGRNPSRGEDRGWNSPDGGRVWGRMVSAGGAGQVSEKRRGPVCGRRRILP